MGYRGKAPVISPHDGTAKRLVASNPVGAGASLRPSAQIPGLPLYSNRPPAQWAGGLVVLSSGQRQRNHRDKGAPSVARFRAPAHLAPSACGPHPRPALVRLALPAGAGAPDCSTGQVLPEMAARWEPPRGPGAPFRAGRRRAPSGEITGPRWGARSAECPHGAPHKASGNRWRLLPRWGAPDIVRRAGRAGGNQSRGRRPAGADSARNDRRQRQRPGTPPSTGKRQTAPRRGPRCGPWHRRGDQQSKSRHMHRKAQRKGPIVPFRAVSPPSTV